MTIKGEWLKDGSVDTLSSQQHGASGMWRSNIKKMATEVAEKLIPKLKAEEDEEEEEEEEDEEDLIDPATEIKEKCAEDHCAAYKAKLDECNDRVLSKSKTSETCFEEILDFYHCVDHCAAPQIFQHVK